MVQGQVAEGTGVELTAAGLRVEERELAQEGRSSCPGAQLFPSLSQLVEPRRTAAVLRQLPDLTEQPILLPEQFVLPRQIARTDGAAALEQQMLEEMADAGPSGLFVG